MTKSLMCIICQGFKVKNPNTIKNPKRNLCETHYSRYRCATHQCGGSH